MDRKIQMLQEIDRAMLFGNLDVNLDIIREATGVEIFQRDDGLIFKADENMPLEQQEASLDLAQCIVEEFINILESGESLGRQKASYVAGLKKEGLSYRDSNVAKDVICFTPQGKTSQAQDHRAEKIRRKHKKKRYSIRHRSCRHRQDLYSRGHGSQCF